MPRVALLFAVLAAGCGRSSLDRPPSGADPIAGDDAPPAGDPLPAADPLPAGDPLPAWWYDPAWAYGRTLTVSASLAAENLTDFPLLVSFADADLAAHAQANGGDILFTTADGHTKLAHELEKYVAASGILVAWVTVPALPAAQATTLRMFYGNPVAPAQADATGTWAGGYRGVFHLDETPAVDAAVSDSTAFHNTGAFIGSMVAEDQVAGRIGGGLALDGVDDTIDIADNDSLSFGNGVSDSAVTLELWVNMTNASGFKMLAKGLSHPPVEYYLRTGDLYDDLLRMRFYDEATSGYIGRMCSTPMTPSQGQWLHIAATYDSSATAAGIRLYVNGSRVDDTDASSLPYNNMSNTTADLSLGDYSSVYANGIIDEVRLSSVVRSPGWILTEYRNQGTPGTYLSVSTEEHRPF